MSLKFDADSGTLYVALNDGPYVEALNVFEVLEAKEAMVPWVSTINASTFTLVPVSTHDDAWWVGLELGDY